MSSKSSNRNIKVSRVSLAHKIRRQLLASALNHITIIHRNNTELSTANSSPYPGTENAGWYDVWAVVVDPRITKLSDPSCTDIVVEGIVLDVDSKYLNRLELTYWREKYWYSMYSLTKCTYLIDIETYYKVLSHGLDSIAVEFITGCSKAIHLAETSGPTTTY